MPIVFSLDAGLFKSWGLLGQNSVISVHVFFRVNTVKILQRLGGSWVFYTCLPFPLPAAWVEVNLDRIACFAPWVGIGIAGLLVGLDGLLAWVGLPIGVRMVVIVLGWIWVTGGLHLDGAMDTADGLAVMDPQRRLAVMADSRSGAFGVTAAIALVALKVAALTALPSPLARWIALGAATSWGRWGHLVAIARYPYLKAEGKGALHKASFRPGDLWVGLVAPLGWAVGAVLLAPDAWLWPLVGLGLGGFGLAQAIAAWFRRQLGGHTGDTYGAVVEWTEAGVLVLATLLW
jgi:adenosylcobinamide-GDP ribazoletransferase